MAICLVFLFFLAKFPVKQNHTLPDECDLVAETTLGLWIGVWFNHHRHKFEKSEEL